MKKIALILISIILVLSPVFYLTGCGGGGDFAPGESEEIFVDDGEFENAEDAGNDDGEFEDAEEVGNDDGEFEDAEEAGNDSEEPEAEVKKTGVDLIKDNTYSVDRNTPSHSGLVLRDGPGSSYNDIGIVKEGWVIQFTGESENNYISVEYYVNNVYYSGWIITDYLRDDESGGDIYNRDDSLQTETTVENEAPAMPTVPEEVLSDLYYPSESLNASNFYRLQDQDEEGYIYGIFMQETAAIKFTEENKSIQGFSLNKIDSETGIPEINYGSEEDYNYIPIDNKAWKLELKSWTVATCVYKFAYSSEKYIIFTREDDDDQFWCVFMTKDVYEKFYKLCTEENALKLSDYFTYPDRDKIQEMQDKLINVLDKCS